eukprot:5688755-Pyramimonas_sp.AAC.1
MARAAARHRHLAAAAGDAPSSQAAKRRCHRPVKVYAPKKKKGSGGYDESSTNALQLAVGGGGGPATYWGFTDLGPFPPRVAERRG